MTSQSSIGDYVEIDFVRIIGPIIARWRVIILAVVLVTTSQGAILVASPQQFVATSSIAIVKTRTDVQFDPRIRTSQPEDTLATLVDYRRNALASMASSQRIALRVVQNFASRLPMDMTAIDLLDNVSIELAAKNDVIQISVMLTDSVLAADVATYWAQEFEKEANSILSGVTPGYVDQVDAELNRAMEDLLAAEARVLEMIRSSQSEFLRLHINQKVRELDRLESIRLAPVLGSLQRKQSSLGAVAAIGEAQERVRQLGSLARAMRDQLQTGGDAAAASNIIALISLKQQVYSIMVIRSAPQATLDLTTSSQDRSRANEQRANVDQASLSTMFGGSMNMYVPNDVVKFTNAEMQLKDLDSLVMVLDQLDKRFGEDLKKSTMEAETVDVPAPANLAEVNAMIERTAAELREARARLEEEAFKAAQITAKRDTLRDTVNALRSKRSEVAVASGVGSSYVRVLSEAIPPTEGTGGRLRKLAIAAAIGLGVGVMVALVLAIRGGAYRRRMEQV